MTAADDGADVGVDAARPVGGVADMTSADDGADVGVDAARPVGGVAGVTAAAEDDAADARAGGAGRGRKLYISVVGGSADDSPPEWYELAEAVGAEVARRGCILVNGGGTGTMVASARGAVDAGGTTIGIIPGEDVEESNDYVQLTISTGIGFVRNALVVRSADAIVALPGSWGTLSEIALAGVFGKPVVAMPFWRSFFNTATQGLGFDNVRIVDDPAQAVELAISLAREQLAFG